MDGRSGDVTGVEKESVKAAKLTFDSFSGTSLPTNHWLHHSLEG